MKFSKIAVLILFLLLGAVLAGCNSDTIDYLPDNEFTMADMEAANSPEAIFGRYSAVRMEGNYFNHIMDWGEPIDHRFTETFVNWPGGIGYYEEFVPAAYSISVEYDGMVYFEDRNGNYGIIGFFDDGVLEEFYLNNIQRPTLTFRTISGLITSVITSVETRDGIRYVTIQENLADFGSTALWWFGIDTGIFEVVYELDPETNMVQRYTEYVIEDGKEPWLAGNIAVVYIENDIELPEYVTKAKDMSSTRTVRIIQYPGEADEREFVFTLPKGATLLPDPMEPHEYFADADFTVPYESPEGEYPDETTIYMRRVEADPGAYIIPDDEFTLADMENANSPEFIFSRYEAVRIEGDFYNHIMYWDEPTDHTYIRLYTKGEGGLNVYEEYRDAPPFAFAVSVEYNGTAYFQDDENGSYGLFGFFDDGAFEEYFLPDIQPHTVTFTTFNGVITSVETRDGVRYVTIRENLSDMGDSALWWFGVDEGIREVVYELDPETNLVMGGRAYLFEDGKEPWLTGENTVIYAVANDFTLPEYVTKSRDMSSTRTIRIIFNAGGSDEREFIFTLPKEASLMHTPMGVYEYQTHEYFVDADFTVPYESPEGEYPDETTIYMRRLGD